jgi:hypothetical protein
MLQLQDQAKGVINSESSGNEKKISGSSHRSGLLTFQNFYINMNEHFKHESKVEEIVFLIIGNTNCWL